MGTKADGKVRIVQVTRGEALGVQFAEAMARKTLEALEIGGYKPTREQLAAMAAGVTRLSLALAAMIADGTDGGAPAPTDAEIDDLVERAAYGGVLALLGPAPAANRPMALAETLARLRVAAVPGTVPRDLARWALETIADLAPVAERVEARNVLLRQAAALVSGTRWAKARRLEAEIAALSRPPRLRERAADDGVRELVSHAIDVAPAPGEIRQLFRILGED
jgi:hypothetical protein